MLADWDSLGIGNPQIVADEYQCYILWIIKHRNNRANLITYLEDVLIDELEVGYDARNELHKSELLSIVDCILQLK